MTDEEWARLRRFETKMGLQLVGDRGPYTHIVNPHRKGPGAWAAWCGETLYQVREARNGVLLSGTCPACVSVHTYHRTRVNR